MFKKSDIQNIPQYYHTLRIRMLGFQRLDNIPTIVNVQVDCLNEKQEVIFNAISFAAVYFDSNVGYAILKDLELTSKVVGKAKEFEELVLEFGNVGPFLKFTNQCAKVHASTLRHSRNAKRNFANYSYDMKVRLLDRSENKQFVDYLINDRVNRKAFPSHEETGFFYDIKFKEHQTKRQGLGIWKTTS